MIFGQIRVNGDRNFGYLIGDEASSQAAIVDASYGPERMLEGAQRHGLKVRYVISTHSHPDHVAGNAYVVERTAAPEVLHESTPHPCTLRVKDNEELRVGNLRLTFLHTPGHTPDGVSIVVTDRSRAPEPWFVLTGDTLFSGGVGRPDLLGAGAERRLAGQLYDSLHGKLLPLPDYLEVYPAHFGGAACGKGLSGKAHTTIGFERRFNPALQFATRAEFVDFVLADLPPQPEAFAANRRRNLTGE